MPIPDSIKQQLLKIDDQLIDLLSQRVNVCQKAKEEDEHGLGAAENADIIGHWEEEAEERGMNIVAMSQIAKLTIRLCQSAEE